MALSAASRREHNFHASELRAVEDRDDAAAHGRGDLGHTCPCAGIGYGRLERRLAASMTRGETDMSTLESSQAAADEARLLRVGVPGLDDILGGGLVANRLYLLEGAPGAGKTTVALQFLREGARARRAGAVHHSVGDGQELRGVARSHGWDLAASTCARCCRREDALRAGRAVHDVPPSEVELSETTLKILRTSTDQADPRGIRFACPNCGCWPAARCATGARSWRSSSSSPAASARCCCSTT